MAKYRTILRGSGMIPLLILFGCQADPPAEEPGMVRDAIVYGQDDRVEPWEYPDQVWAARAQEFTVALIEESRVDESDPSNVQIVGVDDLQTKYGLCSGERFADQLVAGTCSGTLIAPDLVLTAGHCVDASSCAETRVVFNYQMTESGQLAALDQSDVYECQDVLVQRFDTGFDYAVMRLSSAVSGRTPAQVRLDHGPVPVGADLVVNGHPNGLPLKITSGAVVTNNRADRLDYFESELDIMHGNSGSGTFLQSTGELAGILVRTITNNVGKDYRYDEAADCARINTVAEGFVDKVDAVYVQTALQDLCANHDCPSLCPCGDGDCDGAIGESSATCAADCGAVCGDGSCNGEDVDSCYQDCGVCGNGVCEAEEDQTGSCCMDCPGSIPATYVCPSTGAEARPRMGDVDGDGTVTDDDAYLINEYYVGSNPDIEVAAADVDSDGRITVVDAMLTSQHARGSRPVLPCNEIADLGLSYLSTCVTFGTGDMRCWGIASTGNLGYGNTENLGDDETPREIGNVPLGSQVREVEGGFWFSCALLETGGVQCWGYECSSAGELGYAFDSDWKPVGDDEFPAVMGELRLGGPAEQIAVGGAHACAVMDTGGLRCWGQNFTGALGYGLPEILWSGLLFEPETLGDVPVGEPVLQAAAGVGYTCVLLNGGRVRCFGANDYGQLGYGHTETLGLDQPPAERLDGLAMKGEVVVLEVEDPVAFPVAPLDLLENLLRQAPSVASAERGVH